MFIPAEIFLIYSERFGIESLNDNCNTTIYNLYCIRQRVMFPFKMTLLVYLIFHWSVEP